RYNSLNLPQQIDIVSPVAEARNEYIYSVAGQKLRLTQRYNPNANLKRHYAGNKVYENSVLKKILLPNGYFENGNYYFYLRDRLGNNCVVANASGKIQQSSHYYPFGKVNEYESGGQSFQPYKFGGKEDEPMFGLGLYDFEARQLDGYGGFTSMDPHAESYYSWSPYVYAGNNPIRNVDPTGEDWFVNNDNGNVLFIKGVDELTDDHRQQYELGDSSYERLGADDMFGKDAFWGFYENTLFDVLKEDFYSFGKTSFSFMDLQGYKMAERVTIKETRTREAGDVRGQYFDRSDLDQIGDSKRTYVKPEQLNTKTPLGMPKIKYLDFNGSITTQKYDLIKPYGQDNNKTSIYNTSAGNSIGTGILNIVSDIVKLLTGY
ncbi:RHS repeat domain-containing protein, partial [Viscerimonas tarda]